MKNSYRYIVLFKTLFRLGMFNVLRVIFYKFKLRYKLIPSVNSLKHEGFFFKSINSNKFSKTAVKLKLFGITQVSFSAPPNWHKSLLSPYKMHDSSFLWSDALGQLGDTDPKHIWELSRFGWAPQWAATIKNGDSNCTLNLNEWLADWCLHNPPYKGLNWSCGQEAAIRVMHLTIASFILEEIKEPTEVFCRYLKVSAERIFPTIGYAIGQDNNHGSAEACAIYIIGVIGKRCGIVNSATYYKRGRNLLEGRARKLILIDGSSSQYSTNYHRANLETFCIAELVRIWFDDEKFSDEFGKKVCLGGRWLFNLVDPNTGDAPNIGANDGSHINNVFCLDYRDFRSTVSLTAALFDSALAYSTELFTDQRITLFRIPVDIYKIWSSPTSFTFLEGGYHVFHTSNFRLFFNYPNFKFRPSQADALHITLYINDICIFCDGGSYSYVGSDADYFSASKNHNTVEFDDREQMPKLSQFLFGEWPVCTSIHKLSIDDGYQFSSSEYQTYFGAKHFRSVSVVNNHIKITDKVSGFSKKAVLRWRLPEYDWSFKKEGDITYLSTSQLPKVSISLTCKFGFLNYRLIDGWESLYYSHKTKVILAEFEVCHPDTIITEVKFLP